MISEYLKEHTRIPHAELEKMLIGKIKGARTSSDYSSLLHLFYGFYKPLEEKMERYLSDAHVPDYASRRKSAAIQHDLCLLDERTNEKLCNDLPEIDSVARSLGVLYVLEGSTLGGNIIAKMLAGNLRGISLQAFSFFNGYGEQTTSMWTSFKERLNNYTTDTDEQAEIAGAAHETFTKFKHWIKDNESNSR